MDGGSLRAAPLDERAIEIEAAPRPALARARSAQRVLTWPQIAAGLALLALSLWAAFEAPGAFWLSLYAAAVFTFTMAIGVRLVAAAASLAPAPPAAARWARPLPRYTLICPLFLEADVAHGLVAALKRLDYPADLLDVKIVLEEDDIETRAALAAMALPAHFEILIAPQGRPRTKPHALNHALSRARGDFVAIYDAEDRPHPAQLKAALDAFAADAEIAVVQAPLAAENAEQSWIASQFAAEYAIQFRAMLPLLARLKLPLPLGGTSNHFRIGALTGAGGWDPWNVTEDADLGYRLARDGWKSAMIAPETLEEAPVTFDAWLKQRTRWIKGHMQTWLVLMRDPFATAREMGVWAFLSMQLILFGGLLAAFAHGPLAIALALSILTPIDLLGPIDLGLAAAGYATALYLALAVAALLRDERIALAALTMPLYWPLASLAAIRALGELVTRPHHWAKTEHGLAKRSLNDAISGRTDAPRDKVAV